MPVINGSRGGEAPRFSPGARSRRGSVPPPEAAPLAAPGRSGFFPTVPRPARRPANPAGAARRRPPSAVATGHSGRRLGDRPRRGQPRWPGSRSIARRAAAGTPTDGPATTASACWSSRATPKGDWSPPRGPSPWSSWIPVCRATRPRSPAGTSPGSRRPGVSVGCRRATASTSNSPGPASRRPQPSPSARPFHDAGRPQSGGQSRDGRCPGRPPAARSRRDSRLARFSRRPSLPGLGKHGRFPRRPTTTGATRRIAGLAHPPRRIARTGGGDTVRERSRPNEGPCPRIRPVPGKPGRPRFARAAVRPIALGSGRLEDRSPRLVAEPAMT